MNQNQAPNVVKGAFSAPGQSLYLHTQGSDFLVDIDGSFTGLQVAVAYALPVTSGSPSFKQFSKDALGNDLIFTDRVSTTLHVPPVGLLVRLECLAISTGTANYTLIG